MRGESGGQRAAWPRSPSGRRRIFPELLAQSDGLFPLTTRGGLRGVRPRAHFSSAYIYIYCILRGKFVGCTRSPRGLLLHVGYCNKELLLWLSCVRSFFFVFEECFEFSSSRAVRPGLIDAFWIIRVMGGWVLWVLIRTAVAGAMSDIAETEQSGYYSSIFGRAYLCNFCTE